MYSLGKNFDGNFHGGLIQEYQFLENLDSHNEIDPKYPSNNTQRKNPLNNKTKPVNKAISNRGTKSQNKPKIPIKNQNQNKNPTYDIFNNDPMSLFTSNKTTNEVEEKNIIAGKTDIKSQINIKEIENIISKTLNEKFSTIENLQKFLKQLSINNNLNTDAEKAFLVYCWVAKNLTYFTGSGKADNTPLGALQKRKTQCSGYARLFKTLLEIFNIKSVLVNGCGRTYSLSPKSKQENHEWNAIKLNNEYYLVDVSWGSGSVKNNKFIASYNDFYFCCLPEIFIYTHLPSKEKEKWQLLSKKINMQNFNSLQYKDKFFYYYNFDNLSPSEGVINLKNNSIDIKITNKYSIKNLKLSCKLYLDQKIKENATYIEKFDNYFLCHLIFNFKGNYTALFFVSDKIGTVNCDLIAAQKYICSQNQTPNKSFPTIFTFQDELHIIEPMFNNLINGKEILFKFTSNDINDMGIYINKKCIHLEKKFGNEFQGKFVVSGDEIVIGKFVENEPGLKGMVKYKVVKKK